MQADWWDVVAGGNMLFMNNCRYYKRTPKAEILNTKEMKMYTSQKFSSHGNVFFNILFDSQKFESF